MSVRRSALAESDLLEIWAFIAVDNAEAADRFLDMLHGKCNLIVTQPSSGRPRPDLGAGLRSHAVGDCVVFYRPIEDGIEVLRVLHRARNVPNLFPLSDEMSE